MNKRLSIKEIRERSGLPYKTHLYANVARWFSPYFLKLVLYTPLNPNDLTIFMIFVGLACAPLLLFNNYYLYILMVVLYQFYAFLDIVDGALARIKQKFSNKGIYLDSLSHLIVEPAIFLCLGFGRFFLTNDLRLLILGVIIAFSQIVLRSLQPLVIYVKYKHLNLIKTTDIYKSKGGWDKKEAKVYNEQLPYSKLNTFDKIKLIVSKIYFIPNLTFIFSIFLLLNKPDYFLVFYGLTMPIIVLINIFLAIQRV